jgi:hypothetical protein
MARAEVCASGPHVGFRSAPQIRPAALKIPKTDVFIRRAQLNRSLQTLYRWSRLTFESSSELESLQSTCQILVETEELRLAWIGYCTDNAERTVRAVASAGYGLEFPDRVNFSWGTLNQDAARSALRWGQGLPV